MFRFLRKLFANRILIDLFPLSISLIRASSIPNNIAASFCFRFFSAIHSCIRAIRGFTGIGCGYFNFSHVRTIADNRTYSFLSTSDNSPMSPNCVPLSMSKFSDAGWVYRFVINMSPNCVPLSMSKSIVAQMFRYSFSVLILLSSMYPYLKLFLHLFYHSQCVCRQTVY